MNGQKQGKAPASPVGQDQPTVVRQVHTLSNIQYKALESKVLSQGNIREDTTVIQAGERLGIERVLRALREGFVA